MNQKTQGSCRVGEVAQTGLAGDWDSAEGDRRSGHSLDW